MEILLVEDEQLIQNLVKRVLVGKGHRVRTAGNGQEGWEVFSQDGAAIDLVLADLKMPVLDGLGLLGRIRGSGQAKPCVLMTGHADLTPGEQQQLGAARVLSKPFSSEELLAAVAGVEARP